LSLRTHTPETSTRGGSVSILNIRGKGDTVTFSSHAHLKKYLPFTFQQAAVDRWAEFLLRELDADIKLQTGQVGDSAPLELVEMKKNEMLTALFPLTWRKDCADSGTHVEENRSCRQTLEPHR